MSARHLALEGVLTKHTPLSSLSAPDAVEMLESFLAGQKEGEDLMKDEVRRLNANLDEARKGGSAAGGGDKAVLGTLRDKEEVRLII